MPLHKKYYADALAYDKSDAGTDPLSEATALSNLASPQSGKGIFLQHGSITKRLSRSNAKYWEVNMPTLPER